MLERGCSSILVHTLTVEREIKKGVIMAHLHQNLSSVVKRSGQELFWTNQRRRRFKNRGLVHCCTCSTSRINEDDRLQFGYLVRDGKWQVRRMLETEEEMKKVAHVQAQAFHQPAFFFDDALFKFFKVKFFILHFLQKILTKNQIIACFLIKIYSKN